MTLVAPSTATPTHAHKLRDMSAREIAGLIAARDLSSAEVVDHFSAHWQAPL
jgi:hypothetical protein